jgi:hypothetical protein
MAADQAEVCEPWGIPDPLDDEEGWLGLIDPTFRDRPREARVFAQRLYDLREAIEHSGEDGARRVVKSLDEGIRLAYQYTTIHRAALRLFYLELAGQTVGDRLEKVIGAAIERTINRPGARQIDLPKDLT